MLVARLINLILLFISQLASLCRCLPAWVTLLTAIGELATGAMTLPREEVPQAKMVSIAAIVGGLHSLSAMAVGLEMFATTTLGEPEVEEYLNR